jgi:hypothetical protein
MGTVFGILSNVMGGDVLSSLSLGKPLVGVEILRLVAANSSRITEGAFLILMMGISLVAMTVFLYPIFRKDSEELAAGMLLFRGPMEGTFYFLSTLCLLAQVALGHTYNATGADSVVLQSMSNALYQFQVRLAPVGPIFFLIGAMCIYVSFYRTRLIPRWLTVWGLIGVVFYMASTLLKFFDMNASGIGFYLEMVLAPQEMVMAVWLIIKGFNSKAIAALFAKSE